MTDRETHLRRVAAAQPSERAWDEIARALDGLDPLADDGFEELRDRLATWPVEIRRVLPLRWIFEEPVVIGRGGIRPKPWPRGVQLATHLDLSAARQPALTSSRGELLRLFQTRELQGIRSMDLGWNGASAKQWAQIAALPTRQALRHLAIRSVESRTARALTGPCFGALEHLDLREGRLGPADVATLVQAPSLQGLTRLDLAYNPIEDDGLALLARSRCLSGDLERTRVTDAGLVHLARAERLGALEALSLGENRVGAAGVASLMASTGIENLRSLDLSRCAIGADGARAIAAAPHLFLLRKLRLGNGKIGARGLAALAKARWIADLEDLDLSHCDLDDAALRPLIGLRSSRLRRLDLGSSAITARGLGELLASPAGSHLETLLLHSCVELGPHGAAAIARAPTSARLRVLNVQNCKIGADGARALASSRHLAGLRELWIWSGDILFDGERYVADAKALLEASLPETAIIG